MLGDVDESVQDADVQVLPRAHLEQNFDTLDGCDGPAQNVTIMQCRKRAGATDVFAMAPAMPPDIMFLIVVPLFFSPALGSVAGARAAAGDAMLGTGAAA